MSLAYFMWLSKEATLRRVGHLIYFWHLMYFLIIPKPSPGCISTPWECLSQQEEPKILRRLRYLSGFEERSLWSPVSSKIYSETWRVLPKQLHRGDFIVMLFICTTCLCWVELLIVSRIIVALDEIMKSESISLLLCRNICNHRRLHSSF